jgi:hypothetical protein
MTTKKSPKSSAKAGKTAKKPRPQSPLTRSNAEAEREIAKLRSNREQLESGPSQGESDARASLI